MGGRLVGVALGSGEGVLMRGCVAVVPGVVGDEQAARNRVRKDCRRVKVVFLCTSIVYFIVYKAAEDTLNILKLEISGSVFHNPQTSNKAGGFGRKSELTMTNAFF